MEIKRDACLDRLTAENSMVKVISGMRGSGKSYLLNTLLYRRLVAMGTDPSHIIRFSFTSAEDLRKIRQNPAKWTLRKGGADPQLFLSYLERQMTEGGRYCLLLDDIDFLSFSEFVLQGLVRRDNVQVYATAGRSSRFCTNAPSSLAGHIENVHLLPLSYSEFLAAYDGNTENALQEYVQYGGLPAVTSLQGQEQKQAYLNEQTRTVLHDVAEAYELRSGNRLEPVFHELAREVSSLVSPSAISVSAGGPDNAVPPATAGKYIEFLQDFFAVSKVPRYDIKRRKVKTTPYKLYFEDLGIRNSCLGFAQDDPAPAIENVICNELRRRGFTVMAGMAESRESVSGKDAKLPLEIDFVAELGSRRYYIQSSPCFPTEAMKRPFDLVKDSFRKVFIVEDNVKPNLDDKGYLTVGLKDFLLNEDSLDW